jgi:hypothetical protein
LTAVSGHLTEKLESTIMSRVQTRHVDQTKTFLSALAKGPVMSTALKGTTSIKAVAKNHELAVVKGRGPYAAWTITPAGKEFLAEAA